MSTATLERTPQRAPNGGLPARSAVVRWAWRLLRREWRQQVLLVTLVAFTVAAAVCGLAAAHAYPDSASSTFGTAQQRIRLEATGAQQLREQAGVADDKLGDVEIIGHRDVPVPGSVKPLDVRAQDPQGRFGSSMLALVNGQFPTTSSEIALTPSAAALFRTRVGAHVTLDGQRLRVVGLVENPQKLTDTFALAAAGSEVAARPATTLVVLAAASADDYAAYRQIDSGPKFVQQRSDFDEAPATTAVFALATVALLLVSLVAAAGFAVTAQRRLRQLGVLASLGATHRHLKLVLLAHGAMTGLAAAVVGALIGVLAWLPIAPRMESGAGHRIDSLALPWGLLPLLVLFAVLAPTLAAWWPARSVARIPVAQALSARPPRPAPARQSLWATLVLLAAGIGALIAAHQTNGMLISLGIVAVVLGLLLLSPLLIRLMAATASRLPFTTRLALRDLGRHQARAGAALAAITLAIGIPVALSVLAAANVDSARQGNLAANQLLIRIGSDSPVVPRISEQEFEQVQGAIEQYASQLGATPTPLTKAYASQAPQTRGGNVDDEGGQPVIEIGRKTSADTWRSSALYVATPEAARQFGFDLKATQTGTDVLTPSTGELELLGAPQRDLIARTQPIPGSSYSSVPDAFLTSDAVRRHGWQTVTVGWFVQAPKDLTASQLTAARELAVAHGLVTETRDPQDGLATLRWASIAGGTVLALGVLAMTVGTIRGEATDDLGTLTATGATKTIRRNLTGATAGCLALAGVILGTIGAYSILLAAYADDLDTLARVPYLPLAPALLALPLLAAGTAWLTAGREPVSVTRHRLE
ncbi:FtsX-like permease family protein [Streptomyces sp. YC504]|uniref:FtsX-like permease family protein n=1 Tax=Streptomyces mesophilus TaxID=1775132 RepID=A0A6G4XWC5_9ACTN|nr:FtsX-like permease family protein [Streptomyces mesophilus]NGO80994.1 FtsX-like permease family protein [Streptomyces mesophilus]